MACHWGSMGLLLFETVAIDWNLPFQTGLRHGLAGACCCAVIQLGLVQFFALLTFQSEEMKQETCNFEMEIGQQNAELMHGINCLSQELKWLASCNAVWHPASYMQMLR